MAKKKRRVSRVVRGLGVGSSGAGSMSTRSSQRPASADGMVVGWNTIDSQLRKLSQIMKRGY